MRLAVIFFFACATGGAANHYVRQGASGSADGSDWTNAFTNLPSTLTRGDTYYVADGSYGTQTLDDAASGAQLIVIKKATTSDHGTETGWQASYGDGQAVFGAIDIASASPYWVIDGQERVGLKAGHGIKIAAAVGPVVSLRYAGGNITLRYLELEGGGDDGDAPFPENHLLWTHTADVSDVTIQYCYFHDSGGVHIFSRNGSGWLVEHSVFYRNESIPSEHGEPWSCGKISNVIVRYNLFEETEGTGVIATLDNDPGPDNWEIYGNVFLNFQSSNSAITTDSDSSWTNVKVYNNTFVNGSGNNGIQVDRGSGSTWQVFNNLWYNCTPEFSSPSDPSSILHDHNWFYPSTGTGGDMGEANGQVGVGDPFVNLAGGDLRLSAATNAGVTLSSPYNTDPLGTTRAIDGVWDRGAYEFNALALIPAQTHSGGAHTGSRQ
jgi:hypothetical protein